MGMRRTHTVIASVALSISASVLASPAAAATVVPPLPPSAYADTEVSTNIPVSVDLLKLQEISFALELPASLTNCLEVSVGHDADDDGRLSVEESDIAFGWDCGRWFVRSAEADVLASAAESRDGIVRRTLKVRARDLRPSWTLVRVTRRGGGPFGESFALSFDKRSFRLILR